MNRRPPTLARFIALAAIAASVSLGISACAPSTESSAPSIAVTADTVVIDVRTPAEFEAGHLDGAINIDVQADTFDALAAQLPTDGEYVLYCRTGNRSAAAIERLRALGFTDLINAGGLEEASAATGLEIV